MAGVIGRPSEFTREWAYTALTRARGQTRVYLIAEPTAVQRERKQYALPEAERTASDALDIATRAILRHEAEPLAMSRDSDRHEQQTRPAPVQPRAGAAIPPSEPDWSAMRRTRDAGRALER